MQETNNPLFRDPIKDGALVAFFITQMTQIQEEHDIFRSKPNHCISLRRNVSCSFLYTIYAKRHKLHRITSIHSLLGAPPVDEFFL